MNISANTLNRVSNPKLEFVDITTLDQAKVRTIRSSVESTNEEAIVGSISNTNVEELRKRVMNSFGNQRRAVTLKDYDSMAYAMPYKFGALKRVKTIRNPNPRRGNLNIAVVSENSSGQLTN